MRCLEEINADQYDYDANDRTYPMLAVTSPSSILLLLLSNSFDHS